MASAIRAITDTVPITQSNRGLAGKILKTSNNAVLKLL